MLEDDIWIGDLDNPWTLAEEAQMLLDLTARGKGSQETRQAVADALNDFYAVEC